MDRNRIIAKEYDWDALSLSARRAWIEIDSDFSAPATSMVALRKESVDRNISATVTTLIILSSLSARRAWIEIGQCRVYIVMQRVALRKESVDRNKYVVQCRKALGVALRKESVDRNRTESKMLLKCTVALRKESVDRNTTRGIGRQHVIGSLSARRAWIEIIGLTYDGLIASASLSARRAWIEITQFCGAS